MKSLQVFTAIMYSKGYTAQDLAMEKQRFKNPTVQTRWNYFRLGWEMRGVA